MIRYIVSRLLMMIPIIIGVTLLIFIILSFSPGDPAMTALGSGAKPEQLELWREQNGFNDPLAIRYLKYMWGVLHGDLGTSYNTRQAVSDMITARVGATLFLSFTSMALTIIVSLVLGIAMGLKQNSIFDNFMRVLTIIMTAMPQFWMALMMILLFAVNLRWLPSTGLFKTPGDWVMPVLCLTFAAVAICSRTGRSSILEVMNQDYIRTARAKGLKRGFIVRRHALKNSLLPQVSVYGRIISNCFAGAVVLEQIFGINGIGQMMTQALRQKDEPAIMGSMIIAAVVIAIVNLVTDILYAYIDPRIKSKYVRKKTDRKLVSADE